MTSITPISHAPLATTQVASPLEPAARRRRRDAARIHALSDAGAGAAAIAPAATQQLPFAARATLRISNGILYPVLGAVLGTFLLGPIGTIVGGVAGWMIAR